MAEKWQENKQVFFWEKIAFRIAVAFILPLLVSYYAVFSVSNTHADLEAAKDSLNQRWTEMRSFESGSELKISQIHNGLQSFLYDPQPDTFANLQQNLQSFKNILKNSRNNSEKIFVENEMPVDMGLLRFYSALDALDRNLDKTVDRLSDSLRRKNSIEARVIKKEVEQMLLDIDANLHRLSAYQDLIFSKLTDRVTDKERKTNNAVNFYLMVVLVIGVGACVMLTYGIVSPVRQVLMRFRDIASGTSDLNRRVRTKSKGEMGELAYWMNIFLDKTQQIIDTIANASQVIHRSTDEVSTHTYKMNLSVVAINRSMTEQSMSLDDCTSSVGSIDDLIQASSDSTRQASSLSKIAMDRALQGGASVHETVEAMIKIEESARKIELLVSSINEIASQTNLLAINAAIEATKAGEHGKGFAVVAEEVRKLAERARKLTAEVNVLINESGSRVKTGVSLARAAGVSLDGIIKDVEAVSSLIQRIASSTQKQTETSTMVLEGMRKVSESVRLSLQDVKEVSHAATFTNLEVTKLEALVGQLNQIVGEFRDPSQGHSYQHSEPLPVRNISTTLNDSHVDFSEEPTVPLHMPGIPMPEIKKVPPPSLPSLPPGADIQNEEDEKKEVA